MKVKEKKLLLIKLGSLGDVAMATAILDRLKSYRIFWVLDKNITPLLKRVNEIDTIIETDHQKMIYGNFFEKIAEVVKIWKQIGFRYFHTIIIAHKDSRYKLLSLFTFRKSTLFFSKNSLFPLGEFHSKEYLKLLGSNTLPTYPKLTQKKGRNFIKPVVAFNISSSETKEKNLRNWPIDYFSQLATFIQPYAQVVLIGNGPQEDLFIKNCLSFVGKTSLDEVIDILYECSCIVTHDSGLLHVARVTMTPIVALFGPTNPHHFSSGQSHEIALHKKIPCSFCYNGKKFPNCKNPICMRLLSPEEVFKEVLKLLRIDENCNCT